MKKLLVVILSLSMMLNLFSATSVFAEKDITVELDGKTIEFDVKPEIIDGRTMVPLRKIFEEIGALVKWNNDTKTVSARKNSKTITFTIGSSDIQIDKGKTDDEGNPIIETVTLDVPAQIVSDRTLVPARAISESFGLNVEWDENNKNVIIASDDEKDNSWEENVGTINLTDLEYEGSGIEIKDNQIKITDGGDFSLTGTLKNGNITISTKERVKLRLKGVNITSDNGPCIFVEKADKAFITISEGTENYLTAKNSDDGAIYSKENLEIKGNGSLTVESMAGHGIKASDNLNIENGNIIINATSDGMHINDTFKMTGGAVKITSVGDGIDCESIVNISDGIINIETNGTPIETPETPAESGQTTPRRPMWENNTDVEFEKSTKGINAEWMMVISGGKITVNSASHTIHCQDEIEINGGEFTLSSKYDKGISAHGNLTISGSDTVIDISKSTEGIESKNVMTINDGAIRIVSSDDAINATGGSSGMMPPGGNFGGNGENRVRQNGANRMPMTPATGANSVNGEFVSPEKMPKTGEMTPPEWNPNVFFEGMPEGGWERPSFEDFEKGEFTPPFDFAGGEMPAMPEGGFGGGFMGGMGRDMKVCLVINGGSIEVFGGDDCIDANGNLVVNGGTIKATYPSGAFAGNFGILDADGQTTISENASIIFAAGNGNVRNMGLTQNNIIVYCESAQEADSKITVSDSNGNVVCAYTPNGSYKTVLIASSDIKTGEKYSVAIGNEVYETEISEQNTAIGTPPQSGSGMGQGRWQRMP